LEGAVKFNQEELDMVREGKSTDTSPRFRLPKGISKPTLMKIKAAALNSLKNPFTIDDAAEFLSLSRITAHRYLEYLQKTDFLCKDLRYKKVGRPTVLYRINR
jgi:two-component system response regulator DctR